MDIHQLIAKYDRLKIQGKSFLDELDRNGRKESFSYKTQWGMNFAWDEILKDLKNLAENRAMILSQKFIKLEFLRSQVSDLCPTNQSSTFLDGYKMHVEVFFSDLEIMAMLLPVDLKAETFDVRLDYVLEETTRQLTNFAERIPLEGRRDFWEGVFLSNKTAVEILHLAYEADPVNRAG